MAASAVRTWLRKPPQTPILSYLEVRGTLRELQAIRARLARIIEGCVTTGGRKRRDETRYRLTIAFFPMARRSSSD